MLTSLLIIVGLVAFEAINSIDNAIVNAHILRTMSERARRWFLIWGVLTAVILMRGLLPASFLTLVMKEQGAGVWETFKGIFSQDPASTAAVAENAYILLLGGGVFLLLLYFEWLFLEKKDPYFVPDRLIKPHHRVWFFTVAALLLVGVLFFARHNPLAMLSAAVGNAAFFILFGFREMAEKAEHKLEKKGTSDLAKVLYLQVLDASFSMDNVVGSFAFTTNVLLILLGNGVGALVVRQLTISGVTRVARYKWLKNGAMTSIGLLGLFMMTEAFHIHLPEVLPTVATISIVGWSFFASHRELRRSPLPDAGSAVALSDEVTPKAHGLPS
jgi:hypothetical protein